MHSEGTLAELVGLAYEAAADPANWTPFLEALREVLGSETAFLYLHDFTDHRVDVQAQVGIAPDFVRSYQHYYAAKNIFLQRAQAHLQPGSVLPSQALCPDEIFVRSELYQGWARPQRFHYGMTATVLRTASLVGLFGALRKTGKPVMENDDLALVRALVPHVQRAAQLHEKVAALEVRERALTDVLDQWPMAVLLLDRRESIVGMNRAAEDLLRRQDGLEKVSNRLVASRVDEAARLRQLIRSAIDAVARPTDSPGGAMVLSRPSSERPLQLLVTPLARRWSRSAVPEPACALFISDPDVEPDEGLLVRLYGLTPAESRVAALLAQGIDAKGVSERLAISLNTARTHIKRLFRKTDTRRQSELAYLVLTGPPSPRLRK